MLEPFVFFSYVSLTNIIQQIASFVQYENCWGYRVHGNDAISFVNSKSCDYVNKANLNTSDKVTHGTKNLHARTLVAAITNDEVARILEDRDFPWVPKFALFFAGMPESVFELAILSENL